jgi:choline kinase
VIRRAAAAGAKEFTVVTGYRAEPLEAFLAALAERTGLSIAPVRTGDWERPNGHSVLAGAERLQGEFLLLMSDHLFDPAIVRRLLAHRHNPGLLLAVDRDTANPDTDLDDATRVETGATDRIVRIGKGLAAFDAIDTGIFLATPALCAAIRDVLAAGGSGSLSEGVQRLADQKRAIAVDIGSDWWIDIDDPRAHALAEARLVQAMDNAA